MNYRYMLCAFVASLALVSLGVYLSHWCGVVRLRAGR